MFVWVRRSEEPVGGRRIALRASFCASWTPPNKRMHATADTTVLIYL
jgi:hypothetical protein